VNKPHHWRRVSATVRCPACGHPDWCMVSPFGDKCICCRLESKSPAPLFDGWHHCVPPRQRRLPSEIVRNTRGTTPHALTDFTGVLQACIDAFDLEQRQRAAEALGLRSDVFDSFPIGYRSEHDALAIPALQPGSPSAVGLRYRKIAPRPGALKWLCEPHSTAGLLLPNRNPSPGEFILVCEGPSDTLAATQLGLHAVGRWSCGIDLRQLETLKAHASDIPRPTIVVVGDNDGERRTGERAADGVAELVSAAIPTAAVLRLQPPASHKDLREWVVAGASREALLAGTREVRRAS
jgi:hypothetical protein